MNRGHNNVIPFGRRRAGAAPVMLQCPVAASRGISEAIAMLWELRDQVRTATTLPRLKRTRLDSLGRHIEDRLESALLSMEARP